MFHTSKVGDILLVEVVGVGIGGFVYILQGVASLDNVFLGSGVWRGAGFPGDILMYSPLPRRLSGLSMDDLELHHILM